MPSRQLPPGLEFRPLAPADSMAELTALLHRAYAPLAAAGFRFWASHQPASDTARRAASGECWVGVLETRLVATATLVPPGGTPEVPWYRQPGIAKLQQFAVEPSLQGCGTGSALLDLIERRARALGACELSLDTAEEAAGLRAFYAARGYRFVGHVDHRPQTNYMSVILSLRLAGDAPDQFGG